MQDNVFLLSSLPHFEILVIIYLVYHTVGYLILSPILKHRFGLFITLLIFPFSYIPFVKTCFKLSNWGIFYVVEEAGAGLGFIALPFFVAGLMFPNTMFLTKIVLYLGYGTFAIGAVIFGLFYNYTIFKAMFFPSDEQLEKERLEDEDEEEEEGLPEKESENEE